MTYFYLLDDGELVEDVVFGQRVLDPPDVRGGHVLLELDDDLRRIARAFFKVARAFFKVKGLDELG